MQRFLYILYYCQFYKGALYNLPSRKGDDKNFGKLHIFEIECVCSSVNVMLLTVEDVIVGTVGL